MEQLTLKQVLNMTKDILAGIQIRVDQVEQIGEPINKAIGNINACIEAIERDEAAAQEPPELEAVEAEPVEAEPIEVEEEVVNGQD